MYKKFLRWPFLLLFAALLLAALIPILRATGHPETAHALGNGAGPQIIVTSGVAKGQPFQLHIQGFEASEQVQLSWSADGGQFLGFLHTDQNGAANNCTKNAGSIFDCVVSPAVAAGSYTLTAIGSTSRLQASATVSVNLSLVLTPQNVGPGSTIQVVGNGFMAGEKLTLYFQNSANGTISTNADGTGSFTQPFMLPKTYNMQTGNYIYVENAQQVVRAKALFSFAAPSITPSLSRVTQGASIIIRGKGFLAHESISLYWNFQYFRLKPITVTADAFGTFTVAVTMPPIFGTTNATLRAVGSASKSHATTSITVAPDPKSTEGHSKDTGFWWDWGWWHH